MMRNFTLVFFLVAVVWSCVPIDKDSPKPEDVYLKFYGIGNENDQVVDLINTPDGYGSIILASRYETTPMPLLIKTNNAGFEIAMHVDSTIYEVLINREPTVIPAITPRNIKSYNDEYLVVGDYTYRLGQEDIYGGFWAVVDLVTMKFNEIHILDNLKIADLVKSTESDGIDKYVLFGQTDKDSISVWDDDLDSVLYSTTEFERKGGLDYIILKTNHQDSIYWTKAFGFSGDETPLAIFEKSNGDFMLTGQTNRMNPNSEFQGINIYTVETTDFGIENLGADVFGIAGADANADDIPYDVIEESGYYSIVGGTTKSGKNVGFHVRIGPDARHLANTSYPFGVSFGENTDFPCTIYAAALGSGNRIISVGKVEDWFGFSNKETTSGAVNKFDEILVMTLASNEPELGTEKNYGTTQGNDAAKAVVLKPDGDIVVASNVDFGAGNTNISLMKLNRFGELKD